MNVTANTMLVPAPGPYLAAGTAGDGTHLSLYRKEVIREGTWVHPRLGFRVEATPENIRRWVENTNRYLARAQVFAPERHSYEPSANRGFYKRFEVGRTSDGKVCAYGYVEVTDPEFDAKVRAGNVTGASVGLTELAVSADDGTVERFGEGFEHVAFTCVPVVTGMGSYEPVDGEGSGSDPVPLVMARDGEQRLCWPLRPADGAGGGAGSVAALASRVTTYVDPPAAVLAGDRKATHDECRYNVGVPPMLCRTCAAFAPEYEPTGDNDGVWVPHCEWVADPIKRSGRCQYWRPGGLDGPAAEARPMELDRMTRADINDLPDSAFAYVEPGGKKDKDGRTVPRRLRHYPIHDAAHVRNALARAAQALKRGGKAAAIARKALPAIRRAAKKFKIGDYKEMDMDTKELSAELSERLGLELPEEATVDDLLNAVTGHVVSRIGAELALEPDAPTPEALAAAVNARVAELSDERDGLKRQLEAVEQRVQTLEQQAHLAEVKSRLADLTYRIDGAQKTGRMTAAERELLLSVGPDRSFTLCFDADGQYDERWMADLGKVEARLEMIEARPERSAVPAETTARVLSRTVPAPPPAGAAGGGNGDRPDELAKWIADRAARANGRKPAGALEPFNVRVFGPESQS